MTQQFSFKNLVFKGGGAKGVAYLGAIEALDHRGILPGIRGVAGSSAGAITAAVLSFSKSAAQVKEIVDTLDFSKIAGNEREDLPGVPKIVEDALKEVTGIAGDVTAILRLLRHFGLHSSAYFYNWLKQTIAAQCGGNGMATFRDFRARGFRDLHVTSADVSLQTTKFFSAEDTPDVAVADAVRMSMSLPFFFEPQRFDGKELGKGDYFVDGGTQDNYPITIFDQPQYAQGSPYFVNGVNWETLGFFLFTDEANIRPTRITNLVQYIEAMVETLLAVQDVMFRNNSVDPRRTVMVDDCGVPTTDFDIKPGDETYRKLVASGYNATVYFIDNQPPPPVTGK
jgi:NTE family protein